MVTGLSCPAAGRHLGIEPAQLAERRAPRPGAGRICPAPAASAAARGRRCQAGLCEIRCGKRHGASQRAGELSAPEGGAEVPEGCAVSDGDGAGWLAEGEGEGEDAGLELGGVLEGRGELLGDGRADGDESLGVGELAVSIAAEGAAALEGGPSADAGLDGLDGGDVRCEAGG